MALIRQQIGVYRGTIRSSWRRPRRAAVFCWAPTWRCRFSRRRFRTTPRFPRRAGGRIASRTVKPVEKPIETTGVRPREGRSRSRPLRGQTWPYLSRECTEQMQKNRPARVVTTDRLKSRRRKLRRRREANPSPRCLRRGAPAPVASAAKRDHVHQFRAEHRCAKHRRCPRAGGRSLRRRSRPSPQLSLRRLRQPPSLRRSRTVAVAAPANPQDAIVANEPAATSKAAEKRKAKEPGSQAQARRRIGKIWTMTDGLRRGRAGSRQPKPRRTDERADRCRDRAERRSLRAESRSDRSRREASASGDEDDDGNAFSNRRGGRVSS